MSRERGPLDHRFEMGYVPCDEPPGIEEREYRAWKEAGGKVLRDVYAEIDEARAFIAHYLEHYPPGRSSPHLQDKVLRALCLIVMGR